MAVLIERARRWAWTQELEAQVRKGLERNSNSFWNPKIRTVVEELVGKYDPLPLLLDSMRASMFMPDVRNYFGVRPQHKTGQIQFLYGSRFTPKHQLPAVPGVSNDPKPLVFKTYQDPLYDKIMADVIPLWKFDKGLATARLLGRYSKYSHQYFPFLLRQTGKTILTEHTLNTILDHGDAIERASILACQ